MKYKVLKATNLCGLLSIDTLNKNGKEIEEESPEKAFKKYCKTYEGLKDCYNDYYITGYATDGIDIYEVTCESHPFFGSSEHNKLIKINNFEHHLNQASEIVKSWPDWKRNVLGKII